MKDYFINLYKYNHWANTQYFELFNSLDQVPERVQLIMSHVIVALGNWLDRIEGNTRKPLPIWEKLELHELQTLADENNKRWMNYLSKMDEQEQERTISYHNMQNLPYETKVVDIVAHCVNHATYHRAQFAILLRDAGIKPPNTDYITYTRIISNQKIKDWSEK